MEPRDLAVLTREVRQAKVDREESRYAHLAGHLPGLLTELHQVCLTVADFERRRAYYLLARALRAANTVAHKLGYIDLGLLALERIDWAALMSEDPLLIATTAVPRAGALIRRGAGDAAERVLDQAQTGRQL